MREFGAESSTDDVLQGLSLEGKVALVTGASSGLGLETARALASRGARVVMLARNREKLEAAAAGLEDANQAGQLDTATLDLANLDQLRSAAATLLDLYPSIDLLINNAGVMACPLQRSAQGFEMQFGTNHLGHFLFTALMAPALCETAKQQGAARVVNLSSAGHRLAPLNLEDPNYLGRDYDKWQAYGESKTANVLFTVALDRRLAPYGVRTFAVHPGMIVTDLGRHLDSADIEALGQRAQNASGGNYKTIPQGAATTVYAATAPELLGRGGDYLEDCDIAGPTTADSPGGVEFYATDVATAEDLWQLSERLVGLSFSFNSMLG